MNDDAKLLSIEQKKQFVNGADRDFNLRINVGDASYSYMLKKTGELFFFTSKNSLLIIDRDNNVMLQMLNQNINVYGLYVYDRILPAKIESNNFLADFKLDKYQNIKLDLYIYDETKSSFNKFVYTSVEKNKKIPSFSFLKKNL